MNIRTNWTTAPAARSALGIHTRGRNGYESMIPPGSTIQHPTTTHRLTKIGDLDISRVHCADGQWWLRLTRLNTNDVFYLTADEAQEIGGPILHDFVTVGNREAFHR